MQNVIGSDFLETDFQWITTYIFILNNLFFWTFFYQGILFILFYLKNMILFFI